MAAKRKPPKKIDEFNFEPDRIIAGKYRIIEKLGGGWEGEVYRVMELATQVERAAKFFYPDRNVHNKVAALYSRKLDRLKSCSILVNYHTLDMFWHRGHRVACFVMGFASGEILEDFLKRHPGKRIGVFNALQLLHSLVIGLESMHRLGEYHGDLHTGNIIVRRYGLGYELKLIDLFHWRDSKAANKAEDICNAIRIFYDALGGRKHYSKLPQEVKDICLGLRRDLILRKFRTISQLRQHIENIEWTTSARI